MSPEEFVAKWNAVTANERAVAQSHFNDLTALLEVPSPLEEDPDGKHYAFERHVSKAARGKGFADVWRRGAFAWEYKGKGKDLGVIVQIWSDSRWLLSGTPGVRYCKSNSFSFANGLASSNVAMGVLP